MSADHYDTISIGSGEAGKYICWNRSSTLRVKTAVIEHKWLGGSCPNIACLPSKNLIYSADIVHNSQKYAATGLLKAGSAGGVDMSAVRERKREMVKGLIEMHEGVFKGSGAELIMGHGRMVDGKTLEIELPDGGKRVLTADNIVICTGSRAKIDDTPGLKEAKPLTHIELLELDEVPKHLVILGGGYIGIEFAQAFQRFGAAVSVIERGAKILKNEDEDVSTALVDILKSEGVSFFTSTTISHVSGISGDSITLSGTQSGQPFEITGSPQLTHIGFDDFRIVTGFLTPQEPLRSAKDRQVPYTLYTNPELAHVGLNEAQAQKAGIQYRLTKILMAAFLRTRTMDATQGFAKALIGVGDDNFLGFTALGPRAGELLPVVQLAMSVGLPYTSLSGLIVTHPTMNEGLVALFNAVPARA